MEKADGIPISLGTALLSIVLICLVCLGTGLGAGFYFGTEGASRSSELSRVSSVCSAMALAYDGKIAEMEANRAILRTRVKKYEAFLVGAGIEPTLPVESFPLKAAVKAKKKLGVGGP